MVFSNKLNTNYDRYPYVQKKLITRLYQSELMSIRDIPTSFCTT